MPSLRQNSNPEGLIYIDVCQQDEQPKVDIRSERPLFACRIFEGKSVEDTLHLMPMLFNICGQAQSVAAIRAVENALALPASHATEERREVLIALEGIREHLWRILIDWPKQLQTMVNPCSLAGINKSLQQLLLLTNPKKECTTQPGFADDSSKHRHEFRLRWNKLKPQLLTLLFSDANYSTQEMCIPEESHCKQLLDQVSQKPWSKLGDSALPPLPELSEKELFARLTDDSSTSFIAKPEWSQRRFETGSFARQRSHPCVQEAIETQGLGVFPRMLARYIDLLQLINTIDAHLAETDIFRDHLPQESLGISQLETVRGRLAHCVTLRGAYIERYRILAPTEWNFHPQGIIAEMLGNLDNSDTATRQQQGEYLIQLIDPCVGFALQFKEANSECRDHA